MKSVPCVEDQKVNILPENYLHALVRWKSLRKILQVGLELNEYLQTVNGTIKTRPTTAYVLINCDLGFEQQIIEELKHLSDVKETHGIFGAYDILAKVESESVERLRDVITWKIRKLNRVRSTLTLIVPEKQE